jgi:uncharacterized protein YdeI (YjbR/CyaY-like superfamily)
MTIKFFKSASHFRIWLEANHASALELWVGFYKKASGHPSITWPESVDEALCFGWIDGVRKSVDEVSYKIRFSPRKPRSIWSAVRPAGKKAFDQRTENRSGVYSYEQRPAELPDPYRATLQQNKAAWDFYEAQPPSYRRMVCWWIISAKKEETKFKRLDRLIKFSEQGQRLPEASGRTAKGGDV